MAQRRDGAQLLKRCIDVLGAAVGLLVLLPVLALISLAIVTTEGPPVFFRHVRPGLNATLFTLVKFRTMRPLRPGEVLYETDAQRVTALGRFLRSTSLDELPELWNVLRGDMSLVGPRPLLVEYLDQYTPEERRRHEVLPGMTGWAVVKGRHTLKFSERLRLDVWYVDHGNLWLDFKILAVTVHQVLSRKNVTTTQSIEEIGFPGLTNSPRESTPDLAGDEPDGRTRLTE
jgi:sugar transferase EpsL